jgi:hypothetical protein
MGESIMAFALILAITSFVIAAASAVYQVIQAKKQQAQALAAADARKGYELVSDGAPEFLPIIYGRALVGGVRPFSTTLSTYYYVEPNSQKSLLTGSPGYDSYSYNYKIWGIDFNKLIDVSSIVSNQGSGALSSSLSGHNNEFLYYQQAMCAAPINRVVDVIIDGSRYIDDPTLGSYGKIQATTTTKEYTGVKAAMRLDFHYNGGEVDTIMAANCPERNSSYFTNIAYMSGVFRLDRDDPQFNGIPQVQALIEGRKVRWVTNGIISTTALYKDDAINYKYTTNPAWCLLDYLLDPISGKRLTLDEVDLDSFEHVAGICGKIVQTNVPVGGKFWKPTVQEPQISTRDLPLYEANILVDTSKPHRDNIESILSTMGDARLIWSGGKYRLSLQYVDTNDQLIIGTTITDTELALGKDVSVAWPDATNRYNFATIRFHNEYEGFKEDSVSWPPKITSNYSQGVGAINYPVGIGSWDDSKAGGRLLNQYNVWNGAGNDVTMTWKLKVPKENAGTYQVIVAGDDSIDFSMVDSATNRLVGQVGVASSHVEDSRIITLDLNATKEVIYTITITGHNIYNVKVDHKGLAAKIYDSNNILWTTRSTSYSSFTNVSDNNAVYLAMLNEDNNIELEVDVFSEGITDTQHALAKAEELVRTSRSAVAYKFTYVITDKYLEPGDYIKLASESLGIGTGPNPLYLRVDASKVVDNDKCEVSATRFDSTQLAWANKADVYIGAPPIYTLEIPQPSALTYSLSPDKIVASGTLTVGKVSFANFVGYVFYSHRPGIDATDQNGLPIYNEIGRSSTETFIIPPINAASAFFGVKTLSSNGRMSLLTTTDPFNAVVLHNTWTQNVEIIPTALEFSNSAGFVTPNDITLNANPFGYINPQYTWYDGLIPLAVTTSTAVIPKFTVPSKTIEVRVNETGNSDYIATSITLVYNIEATRAVSDIKDAAKKASDAQIAVANVTSSISDANTAIATLRGDMNTADGIIRDAAAAAKLAADNAVTTANSARTDASTALTVTGNLQRSVDGNTSAISNETLNRGTAELQITGRLSITESAFGQTGYFKNPQFNAYTTALGLPTSWAVNEGDGSGLVRQTGEISGTAVNQTAAANVASSFGQSSNVKVNLNQAMVLEVDINLVSGTLTGSGVTVRYNRAGAGVADRYYPLAAIKDTTGNISGVGVVGNTYHYRVLIYSEFDNIDNLGIYAHNHTPNMGSIAAANSITWYRVNLRPASDAEILAKAADTALNTPTTGALARLSLSELAITTNNTSTVRRLSDLESGATGGSSTLTTRIRDEEFARSDGDTTLGIRSSKIEGQLGNNGSLNANSTFAAYPITPGVPDSWTVETYPGSINTRLAGETGGNAYSQSGPVNVLAYTGTAIPAIPAGIWLVLEADIKVTQGTWNDSGLILRLDQNNYEGLYFHQDKDVTGAVIVTPVIGQVYRFKKLMKTVSSGLSTSQVFMATKFFFANAAPASAITWYRASVRVATPVEVQTQAIDAALNTPVTGYATRIAKNETSIIDNYSAVTGRLGVLESTLGTPQNGLTARITTSEATIIRNDLAASGRLDVIEASINNPTTGINARIINEANARTTFEGGIAGQTSTLEASVGGALNANSFFSTKPYTSGTPIGWNPWLTNGTIALSDQVGRNGTLPVLMHRTGTDNLGILNSVPNLPAGWYVLECDVQMFNGVWRGSGMHVNFNNGTSGVINFAFDPDIAGVIHGESSYNRRAFSSLIYSPIQSANTLLYAMASWNGFNGGTYSSSDLHWHKCVIRPATDGEIKGKTADVAINAQGGILARVQTVETTTATTAGRTEAFASKTVSVPGASAAIILNAKDDNGVLTSNVALIAQRIALINSANGGILPGGLYVSGGQVVVDGALQVNTGILVGNGKLKVAIATTDYSVTDGQSVDFGYDLGRTPSVSFGACPIPISSSEIYSPFAEATSTGFVARLRIKGSPTNVAKSANFVATVANDLTADKTDQAKAYDNIYSISIAGTVSADSYYDSGDAGGYR